MIVRIVRRRQLQAESLEVTRGGGVCLNDADRTSFVRMWEEYEERPIHHRQSFCGWWCSVWTNAPGVAGESDSEAENGGANAFVISIKSTIMWF